MYHWRTEFFLYNLLVFDIYLYFSWLEDWSLSRCCCCIILPRWEVGFVFEDYWSQLVISNEVADKLWLWMPFSLLRNLNWRIKLFMLIYSVRFWCCTEEAWLVGQSTLIACLNCIFLCKIRESSVRFFVFWYLWPVWNGLDLSILIFMLTFV